MRFVYFCFFLYFLLNCFFHEQLRELAVQIEEEARKFGMRNEGRRVRTACLYGGSGKAQQVQALRTGGHANTFIF